ncbi:unnamed protein product [Rotaria sp. Silwood2]|nr:unnamed protein product [Rotaria sp. Silwood2]CAF3084737.1 unnamed protein product [Rotaria sp. Silwood2]CAF3154342.1 unnamed protein product [Rotaria sp. Silwood2]CAF3347996.1 unnamed protein product [Rotaria sp. Silwood2]CAF4021088.1 unnamed protein product [Rotaria sp. Silwood2]
MSSTCFYNEKDTYFALREAKSIKGISLVRYRHRNPVPAPLRCLDDIAPSEACYHPEPSRNIINLIQYNSVGYTDRFANKQLC